VRCAGTSVPWPHRVTQPTLALASDNDPIVPVIKSRIFTMLMPNCRHTWCAAVISSCSISPTASQTRSGIA